MDLGPLRIAVTGGHGFLGTFVVDELRKAGARHIDVVRKKEHDLRDKAAVARMYAQLAPDVVIHLAAVVGGIGANRATPGLFLYENLVMGTELVEEGRKYAKLKKLVAVGTICSYPKHTPVPFHEDDLWNGYPEETNAPYGLAKKMLLAQLQAYRAQYAFPGVFLLPVNLYGPGDNFDPASSHVIPALIRKIDDAQRSGAASITLWGDGSPTREFVHARDAARAVVLATQKYDDGAPVNVGTGVEISIKDLAARVADLMGWRGDIDWDTTKPNGQPRRRLDVRRATERFGFQAQIAFDDGLRETIAWWRAHRDDVVAGEARAMRGAFLGMDTTIERDKDRV